MEKVSKKPKQNILFIISDQHRADHLSCAGNMDVKTPNLDALANEGVRFTNAFCANPMCMPNRATIFTGLYPNAHGVRSNGINLPETIPTFPEALRESGYITASVGKVHLQFFAPPFKKKSKSFESIHEWLHEEIEEEIRKNFPKNYYGLEYVETVLGHGDLCTGHYSDWLKEKAPQYIEYIRKRFNKFFDAIFYDTNLPEEVYNTTYVEERTIRFLERYTKGELGDKPFFLHCSFPDPHHPVCPPGRYKDMYKPNEIRLPSSFKHRDKLASHPFLGPAIKNPLFRGALLRASPEEEIRKFLAGTYGSISMVDHSIGKILAALEKLGLSQNTIVIYTSDHGDLAGDHGMLLKGPCPYNGILNVPMIWRVPGVTKPTTTDALISSIDIPVTLLKLLEIKDRYLPPDMQGLDMTPVLKGEQKNVRDCCYVEEDEDLGPISVRLRHLITKDYKLTLYNGIEEYGDLFDRKNDRDEIKNLWSENKDVQNRLVQKLCREIIKAQSHFPKRLAPT